IIGIVACYDPLLFFSLILFVSPFLYAYNLLVRKRLKDVSKNLDSKGARMYKMGLQSMENYREIIVSNKKHFFKPLFKNALDSFANSMSYVSELNLLTPRLVETMAILCIFIIFTTGYILDRDISTLAQFLILFSIASYRLIPSINKLIQSSNYIKSSTFVFEYFNKSDFPAVPDQTPGPFAGKLDFVQSIEVKNLTFQYKNQQERVLDKLDLRIQKGDIIGIVGSSGSGKSTLLSVLLRLYTETEGGIYVDGLRIDKNNILAWYNILSFVPQNIVLLDGSICDNIAFGVPPDKIDSAKLQKVIRQAQIEDFVKSTPKGIHSEIGEKGIKISGGQRQRIGIARALYQGSEILIFDEATSALDLETESMLTESIHSISNSNITMIIVAHRLETLKYCTKLYRLEKGKLNVIPFIT
ncbi:MAG: ATP-binding cassette domain-containing protein, partial [Bacteroidia bacterium]